MFTSKSQARDWYNGIVCKIKMNYYLKLASVAQSTFSRFMKSEQFNYSISLEKLNWLHQVIVNDLEKIT